MKFGPTKPALVALLAALAACAEDAPAPEIVHTPPVDPEPVIAATAEEPEPEPPAPRLPAASLMGQPIHALQAQLGAPSLVRRDGAVQVMLYENATCVLDITLREARPDDYFRAHHITARDTTGADVDADTCIETFLGDAS